MVLTVAVRMSEMGQSRRRVLGAAAGAGLGAALSGCGLFDNDPEPPPAPDPLQPVLDEALALAAAYDRAAVAQPGLRDRLAPLAADHRAHAEELARVIGKPLPSGPAVAASSGPAAAQTLAGLRRQEQAAQKTAATLCRQGATDRAALTGSIAACRAAHAEALR